MIDLSLVHVTYIILIVIFLFIMAMKKSIVIPCALGILIIGGVVTKSPIRAIQVLFNSLIWAGTEFWGIILVISLVVAMSKALSSIGADTMMIRPLRKYMKNRSITFFILGFVMFAVSMFVWPSPAVALVGALMLPLAIKTGIPVIWAAVAMNIFGHGMALSGDYFIQGAPTITAKAAGSDVGLFLSESFILWAVMCVVTLVVTFVLFQKDMKKRPKVYVEEKLENLPRTDYSGKTIFISVLTPLFFLTDIILMLIFKLQGGDATALVGGSALILMIIITILDKGFTSALDDISDFLKDGFSFGIKIFTPVIVIGAFFFLGGEGAAKAVLGGEATGILNDIGLYLAENVPLSKFPVVITQAVVATVTGLDGSGFSGLPLVGATAATFSNALPLNKEVLASMGQIITIWVGGGTLIPWAVIPVAAICDVNPLDLVRKNFVPVICGLVCMSVVAFFLI